MDGVSAVVTCELGPEDDRLVGSAPMVLTSLVATERTGADPASITLCGAGFEGPYYRIRIDPGQTVVFSDRIALPWGLLVRCLVGEVVVSVGYR